MGIYDAISEEARNRLFATAEQLERMDSEQISVIEDDIQTLQSEYNPNSDLLIIRIGIHSEYGLTGWEITHESASKSGKFTEDTIINESDLEVVEIISRGTLNGYGTTFINIMHPPKEPFDPNEIVQGIYDTIVYLITAGDKILYDLTTSPRPSKDISNSPRTEDSVFDQQGQAWDEPIVVTKEMRTADPENHLPKESEGELIETLSKVDAKLLRPECSQSPIDCEKSQINTEEQLDELSYAQYAKYQRKLKFREGARARAVAVIRDDHTETNEEWAFSELFHTECGPTVEAFESGEDDLYLPESKEKDEVYIEGTIEFGPSPPPDQEPPFRPMYFKNITILSRRNNHE